LDIHTLHLEHVVLLALCTIITVANSSLYKGVKGIHWFSLYNLAVLLGAIAVALRGQIPDFLSIVIGNLFVVTGYLFFSISLTAFFGSKTTHYYLQGSLLVIAVVTMLQYGWFHNDTRKRLIAYSLVLCFLIGVFMQGAPNNYLNAGPFLAWIVIVNSSLQCGAIVSYVWMTAAHLREDLEIQASTDPLTGLLNRRAIEIAAEQQILACNRSGLLIAAIILDLDGFKQINDTYGHHCGDYTLITVAKCLQNSLRQHDLLARVGGDEFAVLLPDTSLEAAIVIAGKLQTSVEQAKVNYGQDGTTVSMSFGVGQLHPPDHTWEQLVMCCDKALYTAKRSRSNSAPSVRNSSLNFADAKLI